MIKNALLRNVTIVAIELTGLFLIVSNAHTVGIFNLFKMAVGLMMCLFGLYLYNKHFQ